MANPAPNQPAIPITVGDNTFAEPADSLAEYRIFGKKLVERGITPANDFLRADGLVASFSTPTETDTLPSGLAGFCPFRRKVVIIAQSELHLIKPKFLVEESNEEA